ncbi:MAG: hypothetical protein JNK74_08355 [Candidatus Hydrogenedentes bacterium]|nr:hypothetical protein [Candidatus Hydrogenedentota bacterium]
MIVILLVVAAVLLPALIWRIGVSREARMLLAAREAAGQPLTMAQLNERFPVPAEGENGAELYREALKTYRDLPPDKVDSLLWMGKSRPVPGEALDPVVRESTLEWLGVNAVTLEKVKAAAGRKQSRYVTPYQPAGYNDLSVLDRLEVLADLTCAAAVLFADSDDGGATSEALAHALALARSPEQDGLYSTLARQWAFEEQFLEALQYCLSRTEVAESVLQSVETHFEAGRRLDQVRHMVVVEQCLFLGRVREGRRRGMPRNILIATGVGDLNIGAHTRLMGEILDWTNAPVADRPTIERRFDAEMKNLSKRAMLFLTVNVSRPPGYWSYYRKSLDQAALARSAMAVRRYYLTQGRYPESLEALEPALPGAERLLPSTGRSITYTVDGGAAELSNGVADVGMPAPASPGPGERKAPTVSNPDSLRFVLLAPPADAP